jgi:hypothetical protein
MRVSLALLSLLLWSAQSIAQPSPEQAQEIPPGLMDPANAARLADVAQSLSKAILDVKVGEVQAALEGRRATQAEKKLTVRDLARRNDPNFDRHLDQEIAASKPKLEQSVKALNQALPQIAQSLAVAQKSIERAIANMPDPNYPRR